MKKAVGHLIPFMEEERQLALANNDGKDDKSLKVMSPYLNMLGCAGLGCPVLCYSVPMPVTVVVTVLCL